MTKEYRFLGADAEYRAVLNEQNEFSEVNGYAVVFDSKSELLSSKRHGEHYEIIPKDAKIKFDNVYSYWNHDKNYTIASVRSQTLNIMRDQKGVAFNISDLTRVKEIPTALETLRIGDAKMSFGMTDIIEDVKYVAGEKIRYILSFTLFEISPVPDPAWRSTQAELRNEDGGEAELIEPIDNGEIDILKLKLELEADTIGFKHK